jgi:ribonuclease P protein subunit POP4
MNKISTLLKSELIGREVCMVKLSGGKTFQGKIIDETKNTVVVKTKNQKKRLIKATYAFEFELDGKKLRVDGKYFLKRPEERIKTKLMKRW